MDLVSIRNVVTEIEQLKFLNTVVYIRVMCKYQVSFTFFSKKNNFKSMRIPVRGHAAVYFEI